MSARRVVSILTCLGLMSISCSPADEPSSTTVTTSTTVGDEEALCFYLEKYVAIAPQENQTVQQTLDQIADELGPGASVVDAASVLNETSVEQIGDDHPDFQALLDAGAVIDNVLGFIDVGESDPLQVAAELQDAGVTAAPISTVGMAVHIKFAPGTDAIQLTSNPLGDVDPGGDASVAVVDTGIVEDGPDWLIGSVLRDEIDLEILRGEELASHGTFVAGIIRQLAPALKVSMAKAREASVDHMVIPGDDEVIDQAVKPTSEIHVLEAIVRLIARHQESGIPVEALNLSLGTYDCGSTVVTLQAAIDLWATAFPDADVFAAGGNENLAEEFYPAAFSNVTGVGAADLSGTETVWTNNVAVVPAPNRPWTVGHVVPGTNIVNMGNGSDAFVWSGSSFASAVAIARGVSGETTTPKYSEVVGLTFQMTSGGNEAALHVESAGQIVNVESGSPVTLPGP